jgi:hypothetical protein
MQNSIEDLEHMINVPNTGKSSSTGIAAHATWSWIVRTVHPNQGQVTHCLHTAPMITNFLTGKTKVTTHGDEAIVSM